MTQPLGTPPAFQRTPLSADETARAEANFLPCVAEALAAKGRFRVTADSPFGHQDFLLNGGQPDRVRESEADGASGEAGVVLRGIRPTSLGR